MECSYCERTCDIPENTNGYCRMYRNEQGTIQENYPDAYLNIYPVSSESIPMLHFYPNRIFLLISTIGCNFACNGCISEFQTIRPGNLQEILTHHTPEEILAIAKEGDCSGITFCLNEPSVSLPTFLRVARAAKANGLLVGCSSNGYMTLETVQSLIPYLDFINIGLKGSTDSRYRECGAASAEPVYRNVRMFHNAGIAVEVSVMYINTREDEVIGAAKRIRAISPTIPFQVMRFMATHKEIEEMSPTREQGETLCAELRHYVDHVYLFNTIATTELDTRCPVCGAVIVHRIFFGPMAARVISIRPEGKCSCGYQYPFRGQIEPIPEGDRRLLGGYRSIIGAGMIENVLCMLGITDKTIIDRICNKAIAEGYLNTFQDHKGTIDSYIGMIGYVAGLAGREAQGRHIMDYMQSVIEDVTAKAAGARRPRVYAVIGSPLLPLYSIMMINTLVEKAGGHSLNIEIDHNESSNKEFTAGEVSALDPEIIFIMNHFATTVEDFQKTCRDLGITCRALANNAIYITGSEYASGPVGWIIGLMDLANHIHPEIFKYSLAKERIRLDQVIAASGEGFSQEGHHAAE
ncbi:MAG: radical SAM protein [Methanoregula sp.]|jgi:pyruvate-formate lyase-activating enzyme